LNAGSNELRLFAFDGYNQGPDLYFHGMEQIP
jgi:hypothetical protein